MSVQPRNEPLGLRVLVVDDERNIRTTVALYVEQLGCTVTAVATPDAALAALSRQPHDLAFVDLRLAAASGLDLVPRLLGLQPDLAIVVVTAYATLDTAVEAIRRGARDYLAKPFTPDQIRRAVEQTAERRALGSRVRELEHRLAEAAPDAELASDSAAMRAVRDTLARAAASDACVLLRGESGTGKGVAARALHALSPRAAFPFVVVNCPALSPELLPSELFGHVKGAFTGAVRDQPGRVEAADRGTLFLDELGDLSSTVQAQLLRFLNDKEFERVGETRTRRADVRVVAATNRDLEAAVADGRFREDLLYRLNVVELVMPPLRERPEDLLALARHFLDFFARQARRPPQTLSPAAERALLAYAWPGNVRELRNVLERVTILWPAPIVEPDALPSRMVTVAPGRPVLGGDFTLDAIAEEHLQRVVARSATLDEAAATLGIDPSTLWRKRKKLEG